MYIREWKHKQRWPKMPTLKLSMIKGEKIANTPGIEVVKKKKETTIGKFK